ncbi:hypothetical protein ACFOHU_07945 [Ottowia pentelensis]|uniref:DUF2514 family protein n=2 Tax=Ottowia pentelensis TaxID=511108 RepID=A0ABV6PTN1_9BURK
MGLVNVVAGLALAAVAMFGITSCQEHYREQGRVAVRAEWIEADKARELRETAATLAREKSERAKEQRQTQEAEANALAATQREAALRDRLDTVVRSHDGLQRELARANAASGDRRAAGTCPAADAEADAAATARGVLGACADRYRAMAADAAGLASQVVGLQDHVLVLQPAARALLTPAPEALP